MSKRKSLKSSRAARPEQIGNQSSGADLAATLVAEYTLSRGRMPSRALLDRADRAELSRFLIEWFEKTMGLKEQERIVKLMTKIGDENLRERILYSLKSKFHPSTRELLLKTLGAIDFKTERIDLLIQDLRQGLAVIDGITETPPPLTDRQKQIISLLLRHPLMENHPERKRWLLKLLDISSGQKTIQLRKQKE